MNSQIKAVADAGQRMNKVAQGIIMAAVGTFLAIAAIGAFEYFLPASNWLDVRAIRVSDTTAGTSPSLLIDRTINQVFFADRSVTVLRQTPDGYNAVCSVADHYDFQPDTNLPKDADLDFWTFPVKCDLKPGQYVVRTLWQIHAFLWMTKEVRSTSNLFTVT